MKPPSPNLNLLIVQFMKREDEKEFHSQKEILAGPTRLELATSGVTGRRSNHAELRPRHED